MRSRCFGSMFAWILKTKPENVGRRRDRRAAPARAAAAAAGRSSRNASRNSSTPKLVIALPKNTGVSCAARGTRRSRTRRPRLEQLESSLSCSCAARRGWLRRVGIVECDDRQLARASRRRPSRSKSSTLAPCAVVDAAEVACRSRSASSSGEHGMPSTCSSSSMQLQRLAAVAVQLVDESEDRDRRACGRPRTACWSAARRPWRRR